MREYRSGLRLDHLTHHIHILEANGESCRLKQSKGPQRRRKEPAKESNQQEV